MEDQSLDCAVKAARTVAAAGVWSTVWSKRVIPVQRDVSQSKWGSVSSDENVIRPYDYNIECYAIPNKQTPFS
jgi:hypothetical protein